MGEPEQRESLVDKFHRQKREEDHFNFVFFFVIFWIASVYWLFTFFTKSIPSGIYFTEKVKVYDKTEKDYLYLNLVVDVFFEEGGKYYMVSEMIDPGTGKSLAVDSDVVSFGQKCEFGSYHQAEEFNIFGKHDINGYQFSVSINPKDIQISPLERIENDLLGFAIRIVLFAFFTFSLYKDYKSKKNPGN